MAEPMSRSERVVGLHRQLPHQVIGQRAGRRERVLDRRQLLDLLGRLRPVAVVEVVAEEVLVVLVVPGVGLVRLLLGLRLFLGLERPRPAAGPRSEPPPSIGFSTISWLRRSDSSSVDIGSSLIACCSDGVRISFWTSFVCSFCWIPMRRVSRIVRVVPTQLHANLTPILVQSELGPQVNPANLLVRSQAIGRSAPEDGSAVDDVGAVGNAQRFTHVVIRDEDADSALSSGGR